MKFSEHVDRFFNEFGVYTNDFSINLIEKSTGLVLLFTVLAIYVLLILISKIPFISKNKNKSFVIAKSIVISSMIVALVLIGLAVYAWVIDFKGLFGAEFRFIFLLSLLVTFLISIMKYAHLRLSYTSRKLKNITTQPITQMSENKTYLFLKKAFDKFRIWLIIPAFGFLLLLFIQEKYNLISIVIDASGSMADERFWIGVEALNKTVDEIDPKTNHFVISVSPHENETNCQPYTRFSEILEITNPSRLCSFTSHLFNNESPIEFISNIQVYQNRAHIVYSIWQNFLITKKYTEDNPLNYDKKILIAISDFNDEDYDDALNSFFDTQICNDAYGFEDFYDENAYLVNLNKRKQKFVSEFEKCYPSNVYDGYEMDNYSFALDDIFGNMRAKTWYFIIWLLVFYLIPAIIFLLINPKKLIDL